jgi:hypothetical protein
MFQILVFYTVIDVMQVYAVDAGGHVSSCLGDSLSAFCGRHFALFTHSIVEIVLGAVSGFFV